MREKCDRWRIVILFEQPQQRVDRAAMRFLRCRGDLERDGPVAPRLVRDEDPVNVPPTSMPTRTVRIIASLRLTGNGVGLHFDHVLSGDQPRHFDHRARRANLPKCLGMGGADALPIGDVRDV